MECKFILISTEVASLVMNLAYDNYRLVKTKLVQITSVNITYMLDGAKQRE